MPIAVMLHDRKREEAARLAERAVKRASEGSDWKTPSVFLGWIKEKRFEELSVNAEYWKGH